MGVKSGYGCDVARACQPWTDGADMGCRGLRRAEKLVDDLRVSGGWKKKRYAPTSAATRKTSGLVGEGASLIILDTEMLSDSAQRRMWGGDQWAGCRGQGCRI